MIGRRALASGWAADRFAAIPEVFIRATPIFKLLVCEFRLRYIGYSVLNSQYTTFHQRLPVLCAASRRSRTPVMARALPFPHSPVLPSTFPRSGKPNMVCRRTLSWTDGFRLSRQAQQSEAMVAAKAAGEDLQRRSAPQPARRHEHEPWIEPRDWFNRRSGY